MTAQVDNEFALAIEAVRDGFRAMSQQSGDLAELLATAKEGDFGVMLITPDIIGQMLMEVLPTEDGGRMPTAQKTFWLEVAECMGPDWIAEFRRVGAFMDRAGSF